MKIRMRRILIPVLAVLAAALLVELPLMETTFFGEEVILWDTLFRAILAGPLLLYFYREDRPFRGEECFSLKNAAGFTAAGVLLSLIFSGILKAAGISGADSAEGTLFVGRLWLQLLVLLFAAPFLEELFFRGILYWRLKELFTAPMAAFLSAAVFGLYHGNPAQGIYGFFLGLYLSYTMERTQTVKLPILVHAAVNGAAFCLSFLSKM